MRPAKPPPPDTRDPAYVEGLRTFALAQGLDRIGFTDASVLTDARREIVRRRDAGLADTMGFTFRDPERSTDPGRAVEGARSVIVAARSYNVAPAPRPDGLVARVARYAQHDHYTPLRAALQSVALRLRADGFRAVVFADENDLVDRAIAHRAGLGWFGKNANLLLPGAGSWFVLGSVVTTAELPPSTSVAPDGCGTCRRCLDDCPTGAIVADGVVDARRCLAWLVQKPGIFPIEFRRALGDRLYGCDDCQEYCPPTVRLADRVRGRVDAPGPGAYVDVVAILESSDEQLLDRFGRWYLAERDPRWLRRNALVILANVAPRPPSDRVVELLDRYLVDRDPILRSHAAWAASELGRGDLLVRLGDDPDPLVRDELKRIADVP